MATTVRVKSGVCTSEHNWRAYTGQFICLLCLLFSSTALARTNDPQFAALQKLRSESAIPVLVNYQQGFPRMLSFKVPASGPDPVQSARAFLDEYEELFRQAAPRTGGGPQTAQLSELSVRGVYAEGGDRFVLFHQQLGGVPVFGANLAVYIMTDVLGRSHVTMTTGALLHSQYLDVIPAISAEQAEESARAALPEGTGESAARVGDVMLVIHDPILAGEDPDPRLAWRLVLATVNDPYQVFVDAHSGEILLLSSLGMTSDGLDDYDLYFQNAHGRNIMDTECFMNTTVDEYIGDEDGLIPKYLNDTEAAYMWWHLRNTYAFYHDNYGRHSYDDDDEEIEAYVYSNVGGGGKFVYSCGFEFAHGEVSFDTAMHEFTHAVTWLSSQFVYRDQSGALDESFADVMASVADGDDWLIGEDKTNGQGAIRNLADPANGDCGPPHAPEKCGHRDRWSRYWITEQDFGGVHYNSGISNKAHYLMAEGGDFNGVETVGMGRTKMGQLTYSVLQSLPSQATFMDARITGIAFAAAFAAFAKYGFTSDDVCAVRNAWAAVEIGVGDLDCDGIENDADDSDGDGIYDNQDNCIDVPNTIQIDTDGDGIGDACDDDADGDSCPNSLDNCPNLAIPCTGVYLGSPDSDGDGVGDACDDDDDNDGVLDDDDNCPWHANEDQFDGNDNGQGDACDPDLDGDGFYVDTDNCVLVSNADQADADGDGIGDACDKCPDVSDNAQAYTTGIPELGIDPEPLQPDSDGDGTPDACDAFAFGNMSLEMSGSYFNPANPMSPGGRPRAFSMEGPAESEFRIPLDTCGQGDPDIIGEEERMELVAVGLPDSIPLWITDHLGTRVARLSPDVEGKRGLRFKPDCRARYYLNGRMDDDRDSPVAFSLDFDPVTRAADNPWKPDGSDAPSPPPIPDGDDDGIPDGQDNCPPRYNPTQVDSDRDGTGDACESFQDGFETTN